MNIYQQVRKSYGNIGVYRLIVKSKVSEEAAFKLDDTPENIAKIKQYAEELGLSVTSEVVGKRRGILRRLLRRG